MLWLPLVRAAVDKLAVLPDSDAVPRAAPPDLNVTVPVAPVVTVAVNVTDSPTSEGFRLETTAVLLGYLLTTSWSASDVLAALFASPAYLTVMERLPDALYEVETLACPFTNCTEPSATVPDLKLAVPLTAPRYWLVTVAV